MITHTRSAERLRGWLRAVWPQELPPLTLSFEGEVWRVESSVSGFTTGLKLSAPHALLGAFERVGERVGEQGGDRGEREVMGAIGVRVGALLTTGLSTPVTSLSSVGSVSSVARSTKRERALKRLGDKMWGDHPPSPLLMSLLCSSVDIMRGASWLLNAQPGLYSGCHQSVHTCRLMSWPEPPTTRRPSPTSELLWALCVPLLSRCPVSLSAHNTPHASSALRSDRSHEVYEEHITALSRLYERASREESLMGRALSGRLSRLEQARLAEALTPWGAQGALTHPTLLLDPLNALSTLMTCELSIQRDTQASPRSPDQDLSELREGWGELRFGEGEEGDEREGDEHMEGEWGLEGEGAPQALDLSALSERVEEHLAYVTRALEPLKPPPRSLKRGVSFESGRAVSLSALMASEAQPSRARRVWLRYGVPRRSARVSLLLVDLSASMRGPRLEAALEGVALFALSLAQADQPFALFGFQDELIELLSFETPKPTSLRALEPTLRALVQEVWGVRAGGHNLPQYNDDGPCLLEAAALLEGHARRCGTHSTQALWVISDGEPRGARSGAEALHAATATLSANPRLDLYALGLGEGTEHVTRFYPRAEACVPLEGVVGALGRLVASR